MKLSRTIERGNANLLRLAEILDTVSPSAVAQDGSPLYDQSSYIHDCGAPSCALGFWAAHNPRWKVRNSSGFVDRTLTVKQRKRFTAQGVLSLTSEGNLGPTNGARLDFAIDYDQFQDLFGSSGCGNAGTDPKKAAAYIRKFVLGRS